MEIENHEEFTYLEDHTHLENLTAHYSLLATPEKPLALLNLAFSMQKTGLEGWQVSEACEFLSQLLTTIIKKPRFCDLTQEQLFELKNILDSLTIYDEMPAQQKASLFANRVNSLKHGESFIFEISYYPRFESGHAMLTRFKREGDDHYSVWIYNAQGISLHQNGGIIMDSKAKCVPFIKFQYVLWEEIFFSTNKQQPNHIFFAQLMKNMWDPTKEEQPVFLSLEEILKCFIHITHRRVPSNMINVPGYVSGQRSGNCSVKTIKCMLLDLIGNFNQYKRLSLDFRFYSIIGFIVHKKLNNKSLSCPRNEVNLLEEAIKNYLRMIESNITKGIIEEESSSTKEGQQVLIKALEEIRFLQSLEVIDTKNFLPDQLIISQEELKIEIQERQKSILRLATILPQNKKNMMSMSIIEIKPFLDYEVNWFTLSKCINQHSEILALCIKHKSYYYEATFKLEQTFRKISELKMNIPHQKLSNIIFPLKILESLELLQIRIEEIYSNLPNSNIPEAHLIFGEILALAYILAVLSDGEFQILDNFCLYMDIFSQIFEKNKLYIMDSKEMLVQFNRLLQNIESQKQQKGNQSIFDFTPDRKIDYNDFIHARTPEGKLYLQYYTSNQYESMLGQKLSREEIIQKFDDMSTDPYIPHLSLLKRMAHRAQEFLHYNQKSMVKDKNYQFETNFHEIIENSPLHHYVNHIQSTHIPAKVQSENKIIVQESLEKQFPQILTHIYAKQAEWQVQITALLNLLIQEIHILEDEQSRKVFMYSLMKLIYSDNQIQVPFLNCPKETPINNLLSLWNELIEKSKLYFLERISKDARYSPFLFVIRLYLKILMISFGRDYGISSEHRQRLDEIYHTIKSIQTKTLQEKIECNLIQLGIHIVCAQFDKDIFHLTQMLICLFWLRSNLTNESQLEDLHFWRLCRKNIFIFNWKNIDHDVAAMIGMEILNFFEVESEGNWLITEDIFQLSGIGLGKMIIDLRKVEITDGMSRLICGDLQIDQNHGIKRLFKDRKHEMEIDKSDVCFTDSIWGEIRLQMKGKRILRMIDGVYWLYIDQEFFPLLKVNHSLTSDLAHWINLDSKEILICHLNSGKIQYSIKEGSIINMPQTLDDYSEWVVSTLKESKAQYLPPGDNHQYVNFLIHPEDQRKMVINFTRLQTQRGKPIRFCLNEEEGKIHWIFLQNRDFEICHEFHSDLDIFMTSFIPLRNLNQEGDYKLLVPQGKIEGLKQNGRAYKKTASIKLSGLGGDGQNQSIQVFEYDINVLNPITREYDLQINNLEARIFLLHLRLAQKAYFDCLKLIKGIALNEKLTSNLKSAINSLIESQAKLYDYHPNGIAVRLHLYLQILRMDREIRSWISKEKDALYYNYLRDINDVDEQLLLPLKKERELLLNIETENMVFQFRSLAIQIPPIHKKTLVWIEGTHPAYSNPKLPIFLESTLPIEFQNTLMRETYSYSNFKEVAYAQELYKFLEKEQSQIGKTCIHYAISLQIQKFTSRSTKDFWTLFLFTIEQGSNCYIPSWDESLSRKQAWSSVVQVAYREYKSAQLFAHTDIEKYLKEIGFLEFQFGEEIHKPGLNHVPLPIKQKNESNLKINKNTDLFSIQFGYNDVKGAFERELTELLSINANSLRVISKRLAYQTNKVNISNTIRKIFRASHAPYLENYIQQKIDPNVLSHIYKLGIQNVFHLIKGRKRQLENMIPENYYDYLKILKLLEFEHYSGLDLRTEQVNIILKFMELDLYEPFGFLFQLMMGGGKTSVLISLMIEIISEAPKKLHLEKRISFVLSLPSQMATIKGNLTKFQKERFQKDVYILDYSMKDLDSIENLEWIKRQLQRAQTRRCPLIMVRSFAQFIELKFLLLLFDFAKGTNERDTYLGRLNLLKDILLIFRNQGVGIFDEVDQNLSMHNSVIVPLGEPKEPNSNFGALIAEMIKILVENPALFKMMQNEPKEQVIQEQFIPYIADKIVNYGPLRFGSDEKMKRAFKRYLKNEITPEEQLLADSNNDVLFISETQEENILFLRDLEGCSKQKNEVSRMVADMRALCRYFIHSVLPTVLARSYNRGYGKSYKKVGEVVPYRAAQSPDTTHFGDSITAFAYHALTASLGEITLEEFLSAAEKIYESAQAFSRKLDQNVEECLEGRLFKKITNIEISDFNIYQKAEESLKFINKTPSNRLQFASELFSFYIDEFPELLVSNSLNVIDQFNAATACSATLWNQDTFHNRFTKKVLASDIEETILRKVNEYFNSKQIQIFVTPERGLENIVNILEQEIKFNGKNYSGLIDSAGFLKDVSINRAAVLILKLLTQLQPDIKAVLYLHKSSIREIEQGEPSESFAIITKQDSRPHYLKNTTLEEILKFKLKPEEIFTIFDEQICIGTDVPAKSDARFLLTIDHFMPINKFLQATLRAREFLSNQRVDVVMSEHSKNDLGLTFESIQKKLIQNEQIILNNFREQTLFGRVDALIRNKIMQKILALPLEQIESVQINKYRSLLVDNRTLHIYRRYGRITKARTQTETILEHANKRMKDYQKMIFQPLAEFIRTNLDYLNADKIIEDLHFQGDNEQDDIAKITIKLRDWNYDGLCQKILRELKMTCQEVFGNAIIDELEVVTKAKEQELHELIRSLFRKSCFDYEKLIKELAMLPFHQQLININLYDLLQKPAFSFDVMSLISDIKEYYTVKKSIFEICKLAEDSILIEEELQSSKRIEVEIQQERSVQISHEIKMELSREVMIELQNLIQFNTSVDYEEEGWRLNLKQNLWEQIKEVYCCDRSQYLLEFNKTFPEFVHFTKNFTSVASHFTTAFHYDKRISFILAAQTQKRVEYVYISLKDASFFKRLLTDKENIKQQLTLLEINGKTVLNQKELKDQNLDLAIWFAHLHNGNLDFIDTSQITPRVIEFLSKQDWREATNFLLLKLRRFRKNELQKLLYSKYCRPQFSQYTAKTNGILFSSRRLDILQRVIFPNEIKWLDSQDQFNNLPAEMANFLNPDQIKSFDIKPELIENITHVKLIQALNKDQLKHITRFQAQFLDQHQIPFISKDQSDIIVEIARTDMKQYLNYYQLMNLDNLQFNELSLDILRNIQETLEKENNCPRSKQLFIRLAICQKTQEKKIMQDFSEYLTKIDPDEFQKIPDFELKEIFAFFDKNPDFLNYEVIDLFISLLFGERYTLLYMIPTPILLKFDLTVLLEVFAKFTMAELKKYKSELQTLWQNLDLQALSREQLDKYLCLMNSESLQRLSNSQIQELFSLENIYYLLRESNDAAANLSIKQIKSIPSSAPHILNALTEPWMFAALDSEQLMLIEPENFRKMDYSTLLSLFDILQQFPTKVKHGILVKLLLYKNDSEKGLTANFKSSYEFFMRLQEKDIQDFTLEYLDIFFNLFPQFIKKIKTNLIKSISCQFLSNNLNLLTRDQLQKLEPRQILGLNQEQIELILQTIDDPFLISKIIEGAKKSEQIQEEKMPLSLQAPQTLPKKTMIQTTEKITAQEINALTWDQILGMDMESLRKIIPRIENRDLLIKIKEKGTNHMFNLLSPRQIDITRTKSNISTTDSKCNLF